MTTSSPTTGSIPAPGDRVEWEREHGNGQTEIRIGVVQSLSGGTASVQPYGQDASQLVEADRLYPFGHLSVVAEDTDVPGCSYSHDPGPCPACHTAEYAQLYPAGMATYVRTLRAQHNKLHSEITAASTGYDNLVDLYEDALADRDQQKARAEQAEANTEHTALRQRATGELVELHERGTYAGDQQCERVTDVLVAADHEWNAETGDDELDRDYLAHAARAALDALRKDANRD